MLFKQNNTTAMTSNLSFRESHLWPKDAEQLGLMLFQRTFEEDKNAVLNVNRRTMSDGIDTKTFSPLFYTFTEQLVECHHLHELERHFDRRFLLSRAVSSKETDMAALVTKAPIYKDNQVIQLLHLIFVEQRDSNWFLCIEEPNWKNPNVSPPRNWKPKPEGFNTRSSKQKNSKPIGLGNWFSKSRYFDLAPLPPFSGANAFQ
jgi:hypothetical protein